MWYGYCCPYISVNLRSTTPYTINCTLYTVYCIPYTPYTPNNTIRHVLTHAHARTRTRTHDLRCVLIHLGIGLNRKTEERLTRETGNGSGCLGELAPGPWCSPFTVGARWRPGEHPCCGGGCSRGSDNGGCFGEGLVMEVGE